ncbi:hypothetical protein A3C18_00415 [Candidatus Kaiserbacteria bacterium RIFCSPHIGHO2_02_FULL_54_11b]|uniref:Uncharacterized protein n=2 Tax=Candidatus Kaiseribacteriota TaxID=1752734 RepID=A0A1F6CLG6_9BACT|nr:MAG: hypothetical protein A2704_06050 [Candidatus Kaiserbacteria bacterium RIFCSPHIGHO2_01_FULL_54_36b]OGG64326.1 MAG: hypothetical protein A3C18_00415 [Candidatus Kaiserbacteria bacterium RIFCSPHIGHO2_02_FULL_54_11b]
MKYGALLGWGICIYAVMMLAWSGLVIYGLAGTLVARILVLCVLIIVTTIAARSLRYHSWKDILPYSIAWALMMGLLDAVYTVPYSNWTIYADWNLWVGYSLVAIVPLLTPFLRPLPTGHQT